MKILLLVMAAASLICPAIVLADQPVLTKSLFSLDDLYYSYSQRLVVADGNRDQQAFISSVFRDVIQYEFSADTLWVKVFITTDQRNSGIALNKFRAMKLQALSQFGNIFAARINLLQLPELDKLSFVERIEPVIPDGAPARTSPTIFLPSADQKKK
jgi:hypothetical protein